MNYRHFIKIQNDTSPDGTVDPTYADLITGVPCFIKPVGGGERYRGHQLEATTRYVIETRYDSRIKQNMRAVNESTSEVYEISRLINHENRDRTWFIEATEANVL